MNQFQQKGILVLVGVASLLVSLALRTPLEVSIFRYFGLIALALSGLLFLFDRFFWNWRCLYDWLVPAPDLNGVWRGTGTEKIPKVDARGAWILEESGLNAETVNIEQQFSAIHFSIEWAGGGTSRLKESVPFAVTGRKTKVITFGGVYDYKSAEGNAEARNVSVTATMEGRVFHNKPKSVHLTYAAGNRHGTIDLSDRKCARVVAGPPANET